MACVQLRFRVGRDQDAHLLLVCGLALVGHRVSCSWGVAQVLLGRYALRQLPFVYRLWQTVRCDCQSSYHGGAFPQRVSGCRSRHGDGDSSYQWWLCYWFCRFLFFWRACGYEQTLRCEEFLCKWDSGYWVGGSWEWLPFHVHLQSKSVSLPFFPSILSSSLPISPSSLSAQICHLENIPRSHYRHLSLHRLVILKRYPAAICIISLCTDLSAWEESQNPSPSSLSAQICHLEEKLKSHLHHLSLHRFVSLRRNPKPISIISLCIDLSSWRETQKPSPSSLCRFVILRRNPKAISIISAQICNLEKKPKRKKRTHKTWLPWLVMTQSFFCAGSVCGAKRRTHRGSSEGRILETADLSWWQVSMSTHTTHVTGDSSMDAHRTHISSDPDHCGSARTISVGTFHRHSTGCHCNHQRNTTTHNKNSNQQQQWSWCWSSTRNTVCLFTSDTSGPNLLVSCSRKKDPSSDIQHFTSVRDSFTHKNSEADEMQRHGFFHHDDALEGRGSCSLSWGYHLSWTLSSEIQFSVCRACRAHCACDHEHQNPVVSWHYCPWLEVLGSCLLLHESCSQLPSLLPGAAAPWDDLLCGWEKQPWSRQLHPKGACGFTRVPMYQLHSQG